MTNVRLAIPTDVAQLVRILQRSPEAGSWSENDLRQSLVEGSRRHCLVAESEGLVVGFLLAACPVEEETEILTLAVEPAARRCGVARALVETFLRSRRGEVFLEVRRSNLASQELYLATGFAVAGVRAGYYDSPREDALVMKWKRPLPNSSTLC